MEYVGVITYLPTIYFQGHPSMARFLSRKSWDDLWFRSGCRWFFFVAFLFFWGIGWDYSPEVYSESEMPHEYGRFIHIIYLSQLRINIPYGAFGNEMLKMTWSEKKTPWFSFQTWLCWVSNLKFQGVNIHTISSREAAIWAWNCWPKY